MDLIVIEKNLQVNNILLQLIIILLNVILILLTY